MSTQKQDVDLQQTALRQAAKRAGWEIAREYYEVWTGANRERPKLRALMDDAGKHLFDSVVVTRLDRLARSLHDLLVILKRLDEDGVRFVCTEQSIDTSTPAGKLLLHLLGAISEFERSLIMERTRAGIAKAQAAGKKCHRPRKPVDEAKLRKLLAENYALSDIARFFEVAPSTIYSRLKELGLK